MRRETNHMWIWLVHRDERGLNTAELLGNAALAIIALIAIWAALQALGLDIVSWIRAQLLGG
jgi:hypothetical protein